MSDSPFNTSSGPAIGVTSAVNNSPSTVISKAELARLRAERDTAVQQMKIARTDQKLCHAAHDRLEAERDACLAIARQAYDHLRFNSWKHDPNSDKRFAAIQEIEAALAKYPSANFPSTERNAE